GLARGVLLDGDDHGNATAGLVLATDGVARALRGNHDDVDALRRLDVAEADVEAVAEQDGLAIREVRLDVFGVEVTLVLVGREDDDDVSPLGGLSGAEHLEARLLSLRDRLRALLQADDDIDTRI